MACCGISSADELPAASALTASFESGIPESIVAQGGNLSLSDDHLLDGTKALRWDFKDGDAFTLDTGPLGNVGVWTGYGGYSRSALIFPVYLTEEGPGHLLVEIRAGEKTAATFEIPLAHVGWQKPVFHYSWKSKLNWIDWKLKGELDNFRVSAHGITGDSTAYFDAIFFNDPRDFRDAREPIAESWKPAKHDFSGRPAPTAEELVRLDTLTGFLNAKPNPKIKRDHWERRIAHFKSVIEIQQLYKGHPLKKLTDHFAFLNGIANDWLVCADPEMKREIAACFHTVNDWLQEQGLVVNGSVGKANNYVGRLYVDAITKMRDPLEEHGTLEASIHYLKWAYSYDDRLFGESHRESMDYFHNEAARLLRIALTHSDPVERWHHVSQFRDVLAKQLVASIKPDGGIFHHGFHYYAYGSMGMNDASWLVSILSKSDLPVTREAIDAIRVALESMIWYCGRTTLWSLSGRNATGAQMAPTGSLKALAEAYAPYNDGKPDRKLLAEFLRLSPSKPDNPEFAGIAPAASPNGNRTMPSAALSMHRRHNWLAGVKGYSKYVSSGESYANANRHGLYMSMGQLELLTHPEALPTVHASGTRPNDGYDWTAIEGATTIHCPLAGIANGNGSRLPRNKETFVGGLSNGRNGLFALTFSLGIPGTMTSGATKDSPKPEPLTALKTWFFFDNRIVCLGSDISTSGVDHPVRTNLFQKFLTETHGTTRLNGEALTFADQPITRDETHATTLVDPYGNAYFTPADTPLHLRISEQHSRDSNDRKDTTGNYATAWIEHGKNPADASYEYAVLVQPNDSEVKAFADLRPYQVIRKDSDAHIVHDTPAHTTGYAIFEKDTDLSADLALRSVDQPCLVMIAEQDEQLIVSLTNPDARLEASEPQAVTIHLRGEFSSADDSSIATVDTKDGDTTITAPVRHGESINIRLSKR